ncbi:MAG: hypothetical protein HRU18_03000 [Pseudoalteromonas sp.]|uniref:Nmad5 family putative nucleotide modification protein n=1 Tax=Pseudoalteromonas sp. TaxID=53249 RepID=UPI001D90920C|nr:Nmad5 family putative nucleotide modification protein [Pseudoalteromonas sp.]NRA77153.1 hypothetical protein [Pseudoalteromonas sp.]
MKSIRLNKSSRADIVNNIMTAYSKEHAAPEVSTTSTESVEKVLIKWYKKENASIIALYNAASDKDKKCFNTCAYLQYQNIHGNYTYLYYSEDQEVRLPGTGGTFVNMKNEDNVYPTYVTKVLDKVKAARKAERLERVALTEYQKEYSRYKQDVTQVIDGVNTTGQLLTVWAEVEKFLPLGASDPSRIQLPAVNVNSLNRRLGITKK